MYFENSTEVPCYYLKSPEIVGSPEIWEQATVQLASMTQHYIPLFEYP